MPSESRPPNVASTALPVSSAVPSDTGNSPGSGLSKGLAGASDEMRPGKWSVFCVVAIGVLMATLDSSIVNISLPTIARSFGRPVNGPLQWVIIAYLLVIVALLLTGGRLGDMFGRKRIWQMGLAVFTVGSALCGLA